MARIASHLSGWSFPRFGLGTGSWGIDNDVVNQEQATELVQFVLAHPNPFFDTAPMYGNGGGEAWLGSALRGVNRKDYLLASKAGYAIQYGSQPRTDLSRDGILRSVEGSLERLGVEYLDILHLHDPDCCLKEALETAFPALYELRDQGVVRAVGAGMNQWEMLLEFTRSAEIDCLLLAGRYTLLEQKALPLLEACQMKGIPLFLGGVYNSGILATGAVSGASYNYRTASPEILEHVSRLASICNGFGVSLQAAALQFPLAHPAVTMLVIGAISEPEFASAFRALVEPIPPELWKELRREGFINTPAITPARL